MKSSAAPWYSSFVAVLDRTFLSHADKDRMRRESMGSDEKSAWHLLNERLMTVMGKLRFVQVERERRFDAEMDKFIALYEAEKTAIDNAFRSALARTADETEKEEMWRNYRERIRALQERTTERVRAESSTALREATLDAVRVREE